MAIIVERTTDKRHIGSILAIDPHSPEGTVVLGWGVSFEPTSWVEVEAGVWRIGGPNYTLWAREI